MKKILLVVLAMLLSMFIVACNEDNTDNKIDTVKTKDPAKTTTIVNDNLANDEFSPRY